MSLINFIEKLIIEHGSSTILKERLELLRDQISALEKENSALKSENGILKGKQNATESQFDKAIKEIERLNQVIEGLRKDNTKTHLDAVTEKILKLFFKAGHELSIYDFVRELSLDVSTIQYHFDLLSEAKLIIQTTSAEKSPWTGESTPELFELTSSGREYVVENKLT